MNLQDLFEAFESLGWQVNEVESIDGGEVVRFDQDDPEEPEPVVDPLGPVEFAEVTAYARQNGVTERFPAQFWCLGVSAEMDYQVAQNNAYFFRLKLLGEQFAYAWRFRTDGSMVEEPDTLVYLGYTVAELNAGVQKRAQLISDAFDEIDDAANGWIEPFEGVPDFDGTWLD